MTDTPPLITKRDAAVALARTYNTLDASHIEPLLANDVHYASQWVFEEIENRADYLDYLEAKLRAIREAASHVRAELAETSPYPMAPNPPQPCLVVEQDGVREVTVLFEVDGRRITRIDTCMIPPPHTCHCFGEFPGLDPASDDATTDEKGS